MSFDGGFGVDFKIGDGDLASTPTYASIAQVKTWNGVEIEALLSEVTNHASPGSFQASYSLVGVALAAEAVGTLVFDVPSGLMKSSAIELQLARDIAAATHANASGGLVYTWLNKVKLAYQIVLPDSGSTTWSFDAYINKINIGSPKEEHVMATVTLNPTGQLTLS